MAERLTEKTIEMQEQHYQAYHNGKCLWGGLIDKLGMLEDIMEKYGIESVEELDNLIANYRTSSLLTEERIKEIAINEQRKVLQPMIKEITEKECNQLYTELNTWKKACELACEKMYNVDSVCHFECQRDECFSKDTKDIIKCLMNYFYQQARKEGENETT